MALQVEIPPSSPTHNFNFSNSGKSTPYTTAPSTPKAFGSELYFLSAPTSPSRTAEFYREFEEFSKFNHNYSASRPTTPGRLETSDEFSFQVNLESDSSNFPVSAHELFDDGRIRSGIFKTPTGSPKKKNSNFWEALSPKKKGRRTIPPFESSDLDSNQQQQVSRGRERIITVSPSVSNSSRRGVRSLSPQHREYSSSNYQSWDVEQKQPPTPRKSNNPSQPLPHSPSTRTTLGSLVLQTKSSSRRWRLKDFLLFRSASEGRASSKDPLTKYSTLFYRKLDDKSGGGSSSSTLRSMDGSNSKRMVSAHEMHYTANKAVSEDRKKKTFLPYKQRILGRFPF